MIKSRSLCNNLVILMPATTVAWWHISRMPSSSCKTQGKVSTASDVLMHCEAYNSCIFSIGIAAVVGDTLLVHMHLQNLIMCDALLAARSLRDYVVLAGRNPFEGYIPEVPDGERMDFGSKLFIEYERQGLSCK